MRGGNIRRVGKDSGRNILNAIYMYGPISRIEIANMLSLTPPTITGYVSRYMEEGLIRECPSSGGDGLIGRKRVALDFIPDAAFVIGLDIGPNSTYVSLLDIRGHEISRKRYPASSSSYKSTMDMLDSSLDDFLSSSGINRSRISGMGVGVPGTVSRDGRVLLYSSIYGWKDAPFANDLEKATGLKTAILNNARARSIDVEMFGRMEIPNVYSYILIAKGIVSPCIVGARELFPSHVAPGELGHMKVGAEDGDFLESIASEKAILERCKVLYRRDKDSLLRFLASSLEDLTMEDVIKAEERGDGKVKAIVDEAIGYIGVAIANLVGIFGPELLVIDGKIMDRKENRELLRKSVEHNLEMPDRDETRIAFVPYEKYRTSTGAAGYAIRRFVLSSG